MCNGKHCIGIETKVPLHFSTVVNHHQGLHVVEVHVEHEGGSPGCERRKDYTGPTLDLVATHYHQQCGRICRKEGRESTLRGWISDDEILTAQLDLKLISHRTAPTFHMISIHYKDRSTGLTGSKALKR